MKFWPMETRIIIFAGVVFAVIALCYGLVVLQARVGGWEKLAKRFRAAKEPPGDSYGPQMVTFGLYPVGIIHPTYTGTIAIVADDGLYMAQPAGLQAGHSPFLVPWEALSFLGEFRPFALLRFRQYAVLRYGFRIALDEECSVDLLFCDHLLVKAILARLKAFLK